MDLDRSHFRTTSSGSSSAVTTSELFICFTSRLSFSSSMKLSKSILSPGRAALDGGHVSLSSSLSRRLRTNGSLKGGQASPFFTTTGERRGCAFENPEPSSPKVTCIGHVRVKKKKKVKKSRSLSKRRSGEVPFRKIKQVSGDGGQQSEDKVCSQQQRHSNASAHYQQQQQQECQTHRNQRWVHFPISICEALREFSCLFPCKTSCFSTSERDQNAKKQTEKENGCGAVFARWLVSVNDGEGGKRKEIELVIGGEDEDAAEDRISMRSSKRHVFEDIEVKDDRIELKGQSFEGEEEAARVSICIPPKNALLLMRCRSDPMKMAALANRFSWDAQAAPKNGNQDIEEENYVPVEQVREGECEEGEDEVFEQDAAVSGEHNETKEIKDETECRLEIEVGEFCNGEEIQKEVVGISCEEMVEEKIEELPQEIIGDGEALLQEEGEEVESNMSSFEALLDQENAENCGDCLIQQNEEVENSSICRLSPLSESGEENVESIETPSPLEEASVGIEKEATEGPNTTGKDMILANNDEENHVIMQLKPVPEPETTQREDGEEQEEQRTVPPIQLQTENTKTEELANSNEAVKIEKEGQEVLPECLLLMICEPKLSKEVSKETWVCGTEFLRWLPDRARKQAEAAKAGVCDNEPVKRRLSVDSKAKPIAHNAPPAESKEQQQPRLSCSLPAAASMANMIEQKLANAYEKYELTRCKSEPIWTAAAKLMPESCVLEQCD